jgi:hypothetical protein
LSKLRKIFQNGLPPSGGKIGVSSSSSPSVDSLAGSVVDIAESNDNSF